MKILDTEFTIGADPEVFIERDDGEEFLSAFGLAPGTKANPFRVRDGGFIQVDGMALEYNVRPCTTMSEFVSEVRATQEELMRYVPPGYKLSTKSVAEFGREFIASQPIEARELGCDPDYNAYTGKLNPTPDGDTTGFRTASGHIHIGWTSDVDPLDPEHFEACRELVITLDRLFLPYECAFEKDTRRRQLYGRAGAFRPKHYGVEYRVPSNRWTHRDDLIRFVYRAVRDSIHTLTLGSGIGQTLSQDVLRNINNTGLPIGYLSKTDIENRLIFDHGCTQKSATGRF